MSHVGQEHGIWSGLGFESGNGHPPAVGQGHVTLPLYCCNIPIIVPTTQGGSEDHRASRTVPALRMGSIQLSCWYYF